MSQILMISNIVAYDISAHQNSLILGSPSPVTLCQMSLALCRKLNVHYLSSAAVIHGFTLNDGHPKFVPHEARDPTASTSDIRSGNIRLTLLINIEQNQSQDDDVPDYVVRDMAAFLNDRLKSKVRRYLRHVAGGRVIEPPALSDISIHETETSALRQLRLLGGTVLIDRSDLLVEHEDPLTGLLVHLTIPSEDNIRFEKGWLVPIHIGFQGIEPPTIRQADRQKHGETIPHSFAECISSLGQYINVRQLNTLQGCFWKHYHDPAERTYYVAAQ